MRVNEMHKVFCILGRTATGKSTIVKRVAKELNLNVLKSYTTRSFRSNETIGTSDHIHINPEEVEQYKNDMVAYTDRVNYCSFATKDQLMKSDLYIINPNSYYELKLKTKDMDIELIPIYITVPFPINKNWAELRGDYDSWKKNYDKENDEFVEFEKSDLIEYRILNVYAIGDAVDDLKRIIKKELEGDKNK